MSGVKVAVRVRPFNSREMAREAESIITSKNLKTEEANDDDDVSECDNVDDYESGAPPERQRSNCQ